MTSNLQQKRHVPLRGKDGAKQPDDNLDPGRIPGCELSKAPDPSTRSGIDETR